MGYYVHINVCFACDNNEGVAEIAARHAPSIKHREAKFFLDTLSSRTGTNPGGKGGLSTWGIVGNYVRGADFVQALLPFWNDLIGCEDGPNDFEHVLVFEEAEQSANAKAFEIEKDEFSGEIKVTEHACTFRWNQH